MTIIAFAGFAGSGKDTCAEYLARVHGFSRDSFAAPMKAALKVMCPQVTDEQLYGPSSARETAIPGLQFSGECLKCGYSCAVHDGTWICFGCGHAWQSEVTVRVALETLGTEWGRRLSADIWVESAMRRCKHMRAVVFSDARFRNEFHCVQDHGGRVVRLLRGARTRDHLSEYELEATPNEVFDFVIDNRGSLDELWPQLDALAGRFACP